MNRQFLWNFYWYRLKKRYIKINKREIETKFHVVYFYSFDLNYWKEQDYLLLNKFKNIDYIPFKNYENSIKNMNLKSKYLIINKKNHAMYYYHYMRKLGYKVYLLKL